MTNDELVEKLREQGTLGRGYGVDKRAKPRPVLVAAVDSGEIAKPPMAAGTAAKYSKVPVVRGAINRFPRALQEIAEVSAFGCAKHEVPLGDMSYLNVPNAATIYLEAEGRHMTNEQIEGPINHADGGLYHKAQKAWNALADLEVFLRQRELDREITRLEVPIVVKAGLDSVPKPGTVQYYDTKTGKHIP